MAINKKMSEKQRLVRMWGKKPLYTADGNVNLYKYYQDQYGRKITSTTKTKLK